MLSVLRDYVFDVVGVLCAWSLIVAWRLSCVVRCPLAFVRCLPIVDCCLLCQVYCAVCVVR